MSYHVARPRRLPRRVEAPPLYPLVPLSDAQPTKRTNAWITGLVVVLLLMALLWWLSQDKPKVAERPSRRIKKMSTAEIAHNLHKRLGRRGGASETTMRALARYAEER